MSYLRTIPVILLLLIISSFNAQATSYEQPDFNSSQQYQNNQMQFQNIESDADFFKRAGINKTDISKNEVDALDGTPYTMADMNQQKILDNVSAILNSILKNDPTATMLFPYELRIKNGEDINQYKVVVPKIVITKNNATVSMLELELDITTDIINGKYEINTDLNDFLLVITRLNQEDGTSATIHGVVKADAKGSYHLKISWDTNNQIVSKLEADCNDIVFIMQHDMFSFKLAGVDLIKEFKIRNDSMFDAQQTLKMSDIVVTINDFAGKSTVINISEFNSYGIVEKIDTADILRFKKDIEEKIPFIFMAVTTGMDVLDSMSPLEFPELPERMDGNVEIKNVEVSNNDGQLLIIDSIEINSPSESLDGTKGHASIKLKFKLDDLKVLAKDKKEKLALVPEDAGFNLALNNLPLPDLYHYIESQILVRISNYVEFQQTLRNEQDPNAASLKTQQYMSQNLEEVKNTILSMLETANTSINLDDSGIFASNDNYDGQLTGAFNFTDQKGKFELLISGIDFIKKYSSIPSGCPEIKAINNFDGSQVSCEQAASNNEQMFDAMMAQYRQAAGRKAREDGTSKEVFTIDIDAKTQTVLINGINIQGGTSGSITK